MFWLAGSHPVERTTTIALPGWPVGAPPLRLVLMSDLHVAGPENPPERLTRIVARVNALHPDLVLIAGDFMTERRIASRLYDADEAIAPLGALQARLAVVAVLGNHDHWYGGVPVRQALARAHVTLLENQAIRVGPLAIGGVGDGFTRHARVAQVVAAQQAIGGVPVMFSHGPDIFPQVPQSVPLTLAAHTHCGQIVLPIIGAFATDARYVCGAYREGGKRLIVTAGIGASILPLRLGAPPDFWVITLGAPPKLASPPQPH